MAVKRNRYRLVIEPVSDCKEDEAIRGLRWLLKRLLRQYGLKCVEIVQEQKGETDEG